MVFVVEALGVENGSLFSITLVCRALRALRLVRIIYKSKYAMVYIHAAMDISRFLVHILTILSIVFIIFS